MKFVIDTNVLLSALYSKNGASYLLIRWLFEHQKRLNVVSIPLVIEFEDVLLRPEHLTRYANLSKGDVRLFIDDICTISWQQTIYYLWRPFLSDPKDDMVLETAFNAQADYIITHNLRDFRGVTDAFAIKPVTPGQFWRLQQEA